jgi:hypothetical protein
MPPDRLSVSSASDISPNCRPRKQPGLSLRSVSQIGLARSNPEGKKGRLFAPAEISSSPRLTACDGIDAIGCAKEVSLAWNPFFSLPLV